MNTIWKFPLSPFAAVVSMPEGAKVLTVQVQPGQPWGQPCLWAIVDPKRPLVERRFVIMGTGHQIETDDLRRFAYVGTFQLDGGALVFHVFEVAS